MKIETHDTSDASRMPGALKKILFAGLMLAGFGMTAVSAADVTVTLQAHSDDNSVNDVGSGQWFGDSTVRIGRRNNNGKLYDYVMPFELPDLQGDVVKSAKLRVTFTGGSYNAAALPDVDLYGSVLYSTDSAVNDPAFFANAPNPTNPDAVLLQDDFVDTPTLVNAGYGVLESEDLGDFIQMLYDGGAEPGDHIFLMLSMDAVPSGDYKYLVASTGNSSAKPELELVIGPESILVNAETSDNVLNPLGNGFWVGQSTARIGRGNSDDYNYAYVIPFELPDLQGEILSEAILNLTFTGGSYGAANLGNIDLYGSALSSSSSAVNFASYYEDGSNPANPYAELLQDDFAVTADVVANGYGTVASVDVSTFVQARYNAGAQPGDYVFLVVTMDQYPGSDYRYMEVATANNSVVENRPTLSLKTGGIAPGYYVDPANGDINNPGTFEQPWSTMEEVLANKSFVAGDVIHLRDGYHGVINITGRFTGDGVVVKAQDGHQPSAKNVNFTNASHWTVQGLQISPTFAGAQDKTMLVYVHPTCDTITIKDNTLFSVADASAWTAQDWLDYAPSGIRTDGPDCVVDNNLLKNIAFGIACRASSLRTSVTRNTIDGYSGDGLRGLGDYQSFEYNMVMNAKKVNSNHDDGFQSWTGDGNSDDTVTGMVLRGNVFITYTDPNDPLNSASQGIGCFDGFFEDWIVENNIVMTDTYHGLSLYGAINCRVVNNTVIENPLALFSPSPWLGIFTHKNGTLSTGNTVANNLVTRFGGQTTTASTMYNNLTGTTYTDWFTDYANFDLHLKSTAAAVNAGSTLLAPAYDFEGQARDSQPDIGADEF